MRISSAIKKDFISPREITGISQSPNHHSDEMVVSRNRSIKESELPKNGKLYTADEAFKETSLNEEVTVIMITIATSLQ